MMEVPFLKKSLLAVCAAELALPAALAADEPGKWSDVAELGLVVTAGNSETETVGFKNTLSRAWDRSLFTLRAGGIRAESTLSTTSGS